MCVCVCVCVRERERERESEWVFYRDKSEWSQEFSMITYNGGILSDFNLQCSTGWFSLQIQQSPISKKKIKRLDYYPKQKAHLSQTTLHLVFRTGTQTSRAITYLLISEGDHSHEGWRELRKGPFPWLSWLFTHKTDKLTLWLLSPWKSASSDCFYWEPVTFTEAVHLGTVRFLCLCRWLILLFRWHIPSEILFSKETDGIC